MKNTTFVEANTKNILQSLSPMFYMASEEMNFIDIFLFFASMLPWQPIKMSTEQSSQLPNRGPLKVHF